MPRWLIGAGVLVAIAAAMASAPALGAPPVAPPDQVVAAAPNGVSFTQPHDGRLRVPNYFLVVTGVANVRHTTDLQAPAGSHLVVFSRALDTAAPPTPTVPTSPVTLSVVIDGRSLPVPSTPTGAGTDAVAVSDRAGTVVLELAGNGLTQDFSLTTLARTGPVAASLYRNAGAVAPSAQVAPSSVQNIDVSDATGTYHVALPVTVTSATLDETAAPASSSGNSTALVTLTLHAPDRVQDINGDVRDFAQDFSLYPASAMTLVLTDGSHVGATHAGNSAPGLFAGTWTFTVPASTAAAHLAFAPTTAQAVAFQFSGKPGPVQLGAAGFDLAFPPPAPTPPSEPLGHPLPVLAGPTASGTSASGTSLPALAVVVVVVGLVAVALATRRRLVRRQTSSVEPAGPDANDVATLPVTPPQGPPGRRSTPSAREPTSPTVAGSRTSPGPSTVEADTGAGAVPEPPSPPVAPSAPPVPGPEREDWQEPVPPPIPATVVAKVVGALEVDGYLERPTKEGQDEVLALLLLLSTLPEWKEGVTNDKLRLVLWPGGTGPEGRDASKRTLQNRIGELRRCVGGAQRIPEARGDRYARGTDIGTDWEFIKNLLTGPESAQALTDGLAHVRGRPFAGLTSEWPTDEGFVADIELVVTDAAARLYALAFESGKYRLARWAAEKGLVMLPESEEFCIDRVDADGKGGHLRLLDNDAQDGERRLRSDEAALRRFKDRVGQLRGKVV
ncbi:MAG: hypothetical protein JO176_11555 [Acidimicrobiia bacterium]|nr:hypothetical protein [Acidimicrobiia bacterium]